MAGSRRRRVLWATAAMVGAVGYFFISAKPHPGPAAVRTVGGGMIAAAVLLGVPGSVELMPFDIGDSAADFTGFSIPAWLALLGLAVITVAVAYPTGIVAARILGAWLVLRSSLLTEVIAATITGGGSAQRSSVGDPAGRRCAGIAGVVRETRRTRIPPPTRAVRWWSGAPDVVDTCGLSDEPPGPDAADCNPPRA